MMMRPVALQPPHFARELIPESSFSSCLPTIHHPMYDHDSNETYGKRKGYRMVLFFFLFIIIKMLLIGIYWNCAIVRNTYRIDMYRNEKLKHINLGF